MCNVVSRSFFSKTRKLRWICPLILFLTPLFCRADTLNPIPRPQNGKIVEDCNEVSSVSISLTDSSGAEIGAGTITVNCNLPNVVGTFITPVIQIPAVVQTSSGPVNVADFRQTTTRLQGSGEVADLSVEAVFLDPATNKYVIGSVFGLLADTVGFTSVAIPDLFADTNHDGSLDTGDILYSVVDLSTYLNAIPSFTLGESFNIVNGTVAGLPGMVFSTTPLSFDPNTGQFTGTLYSGTGFADASHLPSATPEPSSVMLLMIPLSAGYIYRRKQKSARAARFWDALAN